MRVRVIAQQHAKVFVDAQKRAVPPVAIYRFANTMGQAAPFFVQGPRAFVFPSGDPVQGVPRPSFEQVWGLYIGTALGIERGFLWTGAGVIVGGPKRQ